MSAPLRTSRSRSKTVPDTAAEDATSMAIDPSLDRRSPSRPPQSPLSSPPPSLPPPESLPSTSNELRANALESLRNSKAAKGPPIMSVELDSRVDRIDNRSNADTSSLSELMDGSDDESEQASYDEEPLPQSVASYHEDENDSEAETERLDATPRKDLALDKSRASEIAEAVARTPSKLAHTTLAEEADSLPTSPVSPAISDIVDDDDNADDGDAEGDGQSTSLQTSNATASESGSIKEGPGRKRKRSTPAMSVAEDLESEQPAKKRSSSSKGSGSDIKIEEALAEHSVENHEMVDDDDPKPEEQDVADQMEETTEAPDAADEVVEEAPASGRGRGGRRGKKKGRRVVETTDRASGTPLPADTVEDEDGAQGDLNEEETAAIEEEVARKKRAIDNLTRIEQKFKIFREKFCDEQIAHIDRVLEALQKTSPPLPEFHSMLKCVDERRDEKIALEKTAYAYKKRCLENKITAERHQLHSQYFQTVRDVRDRSMEHCNKRLYQLQKERRRTGAEETEYSYLFTEKKAEQIRQHNAIVKEISVLAGIARHVGFPAAPDIKGARRAEIDEDLKAMNLHIRQRQSLPNPFTEGVRIDRTAAEAERAFIEQTPWANPQHPAHQGQFGSIPTPQGRHPSNPLITPATQRRPVESQALQGSASTIDLVSNPPSSAAGHGGNSVERTRQTMPDEESPVLARRVPSHTQPSHPSTAEQQHRQGRRTPVPQQKFVPGDDHPFSSPPAAIAKSHWSSAGPTSNPTEPSRAPFGPRNTPLSVAAAAGGGSGAFGR